MGLDFVYTQPVKIYFGAGKLEALGLILEELGLRRCVAVCDPFLRTRLEGLRERVPALCGIYSGIQPNPQLSGTAAVAALIRERDADGVVAVGGGSTLDTAKFAAAIAYNGGEALDYFRGRRVFPTDHIPVVAAPSTAGTGSEVTQVSVMSYGSEKKTINHPAFMPRAALVDPSLTRSVPQKVTMITGLDALAHALEGFWSRNHQPISDQMARQAIRLVLDNLERAWRDGSDLEARSNMSLAALFGGLAFALPKTAGCHACSYPLSEDCGLPHGEACAFTLDSFVRINADERLEALCRELGLSGAEELARRIAALKQLGGLKTRLSQLENADPAKLARDSAVHPLMKNNPVPMDEAALRRMFEALA